MTLKEAFELFNLDFTRLVVKVEGGSSKGYDSFAITPRDFLRYAKIDFHENPDEERNIINTLSNSKRAIDCQIDEMFNRININHNALPKSLDEFIRLFKFNEDLPYKAKVIQALNLAPGFLISKFRTLRNKLEHSYELPDKDSVRESIDVAELFIRCIDVKLKSLDTEFLLTDVDNFIEDDEIFTNYKTGFTFSFREGGFTVFMRKDDKKVKGLQIQPDDKMYFALLKLMYSLDDPYEVEEAIKVIAVIVGNQTKPEEIYVNLY